MQWPSLVSVQAPERELDSILTDMNFDSKIPVLNPLSPVSVLRPCIIVFMKCLAYDIQTLQEHVSHRLC